MKAVHLNYPGELTRHRRIDGVQQGPDVVWTGSAFQKDVYPGTLVRGDRVNPNPWEYYVRVRESFPISAWWLEVNPAATTFDMYEGEYVPIQEHLAYRHDALMSSSDTKAYSKLVESIRGSLDLSVDLAQAGKTARLGKDVQKSVVALGRAVRELRRNPLLAGKTIAKLTGEMRLIWVYGVKPTAQSLYQAVEESYTIMSTKGVWYQGKASEGAVYGETGSHWPDSGQWQWKSTVNDQCGTAYAVKMVIPQNSMTWAARWYSLNPVSIAWELMPFSFVVDWFMNVGDYLRNLESQLIYSRFFATGYKSQRFSVLTRQEAYRNGQTSSGTTHISWGGHYQATAFDRYMKRVVLTDFPSVPPLRWNPDLGSARLLNAAALLSTALQVRRR